MMSGALLGGSSVHQAAKLQMILIFMTSSATALASTFATVVVIAATVDGDHRIRDDRIDGGIHSLWRARDAAVRETAILLKGLLGVNSGSGYGKMVIHAEVKQGS
jgi:hypothetical protein